MWLCPNRLVSKKGEETVNLFGGTKLNGFGNKLTSAFLKSNRWKTQPIS